MRVSEIYYSIQGEGSSTGVPTVFVRFAGCNYKCSGWPCDTQHAISPEYRKEWRYMTAEEITNTITSLWFRGCNVCITGGEPLMQPDKELHELVNRLNDYLGAAAHSGATFDIDVFTNGSVLIPEWMIDECYFTMDWKLPSSGEIPDNNVLAANLIALHEVKNNAVKFTVGSKADLDQALQNYNATLRNLPYLGVYLGRVRNSELTDADLVEFIGKNKLPWSLNVQLHNIIWDPASRGI
jgi:7-carboxy-7-deazaguanine synthase